MRQDYFAVQVFDTETKSAYHLYAASIMDARICNSFTHHLKNWQIVAFNDDVDVKLDMSLN